MNCTYPPEEYVKLLNTYLELDKLAFSPDTDRETVLKKLKERSDERRRIADRANTMIREYIEPFQQAQEILTASDVETLEAFFRGPLSFSKHHWAGSGDHVSGVKAPAGLLPRLRGQPALCPDAVPVYLTGAGPQHLSHGTTLPRLPLSP